MGEENRNIHVYFESIDSFQVLSLAAKLASKLNYSLTVVIQQRPIKSSRSVSGERAKTSAAPVPAAASRTASASVKIARLSAKEKMKASGLAKEQGRNSPILLNS